MKTLLWTGKRKYVHVQYIYIYVCVPNLFTCNKTEKQHFLRLTNENQVNSAHRLLMFWYVDYIWRRDFFVEEMKNGEGKYLFLWRRGKRKTIFGEGNFFLLWRKRRAEKEKEKKYLKKNKYFLQRRRKRRKIFAERKYLVHRGEEEQRRKRGNHLEKEN